MDGKWIQMKLKMSSEKWRMSSIVLFIRYLGNSSLLAESLFDLSFQLFLKRLLWFQITIPDKLMAKVIGNPGTKNEIISVVKGELFPTRINKILNYFKKT